jgi:hypothetical protein
LNFEHKKIAVLLEAVWTGGAVEEADRRLLGQQSQTKKTAFCFLSKSNGLQCFDALKKCFQIAAAGTVHRSASELQKSQKSAVTMFDKVLNKSGLNDTEKTAARTSFGAALTQLSG